MARVLFGAGVTSMKGSIGGSTFQTNTSGNIVRSRPATKKRQTANQSNSIARFAALSSAWSDLSLANKILYNDFAAANQKTNKFGQLKTLTGFAMFQSINSWLLFFNLPLLTVPPAFSIPAPVIDYTVSLNANDLTINSFNRTLASNELLLVFTTFPTSRNTLSNNNQMLFTKQYDNRIAPPINLTTAWNDAHGLDYVEARLTGQFNIGFNLMVLDKQNGITSVGNFKTFSF